MLAEASAAREVVDRLSAEPRGLVRASVPVSIAQESMPRLLPDFLAKYPKVRVQLHVSNRRVDVINEGFDVAIRVRAKLDDDGSLVMRSFGQIQELLVASPKYLDRAGRPRDPDELANHTTLSMSEDDARQRWDLHDANKEVRRVELKPRVSGFDFPMLMAMAKQGMGITLLPETICAEAVRNWKWCCPPGACRWVSATPCSPPVAACCRRCGCSSTTSLKPCRRYLRPPASTVCIVQVGWRRRNRLKSPSLHKGGWVQTSGSRGANLRASSRAEGPAGVLSGTGESRPLTQLSCYSGWQKVPLPAI
jgi:DNA-binding transcriptional LysR family regulator